MAILAVISGQTRPASLARSRGPKLIFWAKDLHRLRHMKIPLRRMLPPFQAFVHSESTGGILLLLAAVAAFVLANSPWAPAYAAIKHFHLRVGWQGYAIDQSLFHWANDGLMVLFFLLVGLEIKREVRGGELSSARAAALPVLAALGGMLVPAMIFAGLNWGDPGLKGWGIPMATDIAFALGIVTLMGKRIPAGVRIFLTALAIADDLGAVVVIALFYSHGLDWGAVGIVLACWLAALFYGLRGGRLLSVYAVLGLVMWLFMLRSGIHATVAGILLALTLPQATPDAGSAEHDAPLHRMEHLLEPWVAYLVVPLFAFLNAGFALSSEAGLTQPIVLGALLGLLLGKPIGVTGASWLAVKLRLAELPQDVTWRHILGAAALAGIGFTMSLFIADLAFARPQFLNYAKLGILTASLASAALGFVLLLTARPASDKTTG